jgi:hypothetical protein
MVTIAHYGDPIEAGAHRVYEKAAVSSYPPGSASRASIDFDWASEDQMGRIRQASDSIFCSEGFAAHQRCEIGTLYLRHNLDAGVCKSSANIARADF